MSKAEETPGSKSVHEKWMQLALELAHKAEVEGEVPVGAVVVLDDEVIGEGYNQTITLADPTAHAEMNAMRDAAKRIGNYRLVDCDLYATIEPCTMCAGAMVHARIRGLYYGAPEPRAGAAGSTIDVLANPALNHRVSVTGGVCEAEASQLMTDFFRSRRQP